MPTRALRTRLAARQGNQGLSWGELPGGAGCPGGREGESAPGLLCLPPALPATSFLQDHTHSFRPGSPPTQLLTD